LTPADGRNYRREAVGASIRPRRTPGDVLTDDGPRSVESIEVAVTSIASMRLGGVISDVQIVGRGCRLGDECGYIGIHSTVENVPNLDVWIRGAEDGGVGNHRILRCKVRSRSTFEIDHNISLSGKARTSHGTDVDDHPRPLTTSKIGHGAELVIWATTRCIIEEDVGNTVSTLVKIDFVTDDTQRPRTTRIGTIGIRPDVTIHTNASASQHRGASDEVLLQRGEIVQLARHQLWVIGKFRGDKIVIHPKAAEVRAGSWVIGWRKSVAACSGIDVWSVARVHDKDGYRSGSIGYLFPRTKVIREDVTRNGHLEKFGSLR
jgi:hypothetical protein